MFTLKKKTLITPSVMTQTIDTRTEKIALLVALFLVAFGLGLIADGSKLHARQLKAAQRIDYKATLNPFAQYARKNKNPSKMVTSAGVSRLDDDAKCCITANAIKMAQEEGFEPPTNRLTADCSTTELLLNRTNLINQKPNRCL